ncbi:unnamed protein product [Schistosoma turkestanicum]|nr:unnamed protein product [Schistosoma turkestanicum]
MSCSQIALECTRDRFNLVYPHPKVFYQFRYICFSRGNAFAIYRCIFAFLFVTLLILDYIWIILRDSKFPDFLSWYLDASQWALLSTAICYLILAYNTVLIFRRNGESNNETTIPYKFVWLLYTCSVNSVYSTMTLHWMITGLQYSLEQTLKHSLPGCLILMDLFLNSIPLYLCHAFYPVIVHLLYLAIVTFSLYLSYTLGNLNKTIPFPSNPTVLIGGHALLPNGYQDFSNLSRILLTLLGAIFIGIMIHCILLTLVIIRDFLASLCQQSTNQWYDPNDLVYLMDNNNSTTTLDMLSRQSSSSVGVQNFSEKLR